jgi:hypothetical protein
MAGQKARSAVFAPEVPAISFWGHGLALSVAIIGHVQNTGKSRE